MLGAYLAAFKEYVPSRFVQNISDADVRRKNNKMSKQLAAPQGVPQFPCLIKCVMKWEEKELSFQRILEKEGSRTKFSGEKSHAENSEFMGITNQGGRWFR